MGFATLKCPKIVCVGRNYVEHIHELGNEVPDEAVYFMKPVSSVSEEFLYKEGLHYEGEICFMVKSGRLAKVGFGFDLTLRDVQQRLKEKGLPWERAKAFKASALFSNFIPIESWEGLEVRVYRNGELVQRGDTSLMIFKPPKLLEEIDEVFGLNDGDIIMSGTPKGVGEVQLGDRFRGEIWQDGRCLVAKEWEVRSR